MYENTRGLIDSLVPLDFSIVSFSYNPHLFILLNNALNKFGTGKQYLKKILLNLPTTATSVS